MNLIFQTIRLPRSSDKMDELPIKMDTHSMDRLDRPWLSGLSMKVIYIGKFFYLVGVHVNPPARINSPARQEIWFLAVEIFSPKEKKSQP